MSYPYQISSLQEYHEAYRESIDDPEKFWGEVATHFLWRQRWTKVMDCEFDTPSIRWFEGGKLNITENCLDRHLADNGETTAIIWEPNDPSQAGIKWTYRQLHHEVVKCAAMLRSLGIKKGDRVCIYMGMIPELAVAVLACARVGAIHSVIFGGFSAQSIADRVHDAGASYIITCDGAYRGAKSIDLKSVVDEALISCDSVVKVVVCQRTASPVQMIPGRDIWWHEAMSDVNMDLGYAEVMDAEDPLFILYTSGSTGKPKGVVHSCAGYMIYATYTFVNVFQYKRGDIHFCTADVGWITGHSYILYGPLCAGGTTVMFEGVPTWPDAGRLWEIIDKYGVHILYTAPTAIRSLMSFGLAPFDGKSLTSLKVLGTVGEPINEEAWHWYDDNVGKGKCPIVDTWWQTETGGIMISNLAGITQAKPAHATLPLPGVRPILVDEQGNEITGNSVSGNLCITQAWPSTIRTTYGDHERCRTNYFSTYPGRYFTGDGALRDGDGNYRITGRVDDVLNVSGHRIGTAEVENAINSHPQVIESAIVGYPHDIKGQGIYAYVIMSPSVGEAIDHFELRSQILDTVSAVIGPIAKPDKVQIVKGLPKTRSGKIMRRILRKVAEGEINNIGDTTSLLDPAVVDEIINGRL